MTRILAIGFHGVARAAETPARSAPILATEDGHVAFEKRDGGFGVDVERWPTGPLPRATRFPSPIDAHPGWLVLVLGPEDVAALRAAESSQARALIDPKTAFSAAQEIDDCLAVYADPSVVEHAWIVLRDAIRARLMEAARVGGTGLEQAAWRLQRAAIDDKDRFDALAGLHRAGSSLWRRAVRGLYPEREDEVAAEVERRSAALVQSPDSPGQSGGGGASPDVDGPKARYGGMGSSRDRLRFASSVHSEAA